MIATAARRWEVASQECSSIARPGGQNGSGPCLTIQTNYSSKKGSSAICWGFCQFGQVSIAESVANGRPPALAIGPGVSAKARRGDLPQRAVCLLGCNAYQGAAPGSWSRVEKGLAWVMWLPHSPLVLAIGD